MLEPDPSATFSLMLACDRRNLEGRARERAVQVGVMFGGISLALAFVVVRQGLVHSLGWFIALPIAFSCYFLISGSCGVCAFRSLMGQREADYGAEPILRGDSLRNVRARALLTLSVSVVVACVFAAMFVKSAA